ncbi:siphovirus Gp157 family protein [Paludibacterium denitrificans]|uniref:Siphovirus Gp157 family protein n=1 Tax=Paludibacterium denitrificans TaxID=2675226 RepID=A0A844GBU4_9NEIS|nr:siphovirus Gp157 family protein [Paludibacterium denitrificans]MTD33996.1 hypothetical protein [Paludibacterium denitrificans]
MNLFELNRAFAEMEASLSASLAADVAEGKLTEEQAKQIYLDTLEGESGDIETKLLNYAKVIKNKEAEAAALDERIKSLQARKKALEGGKDNLASLAVKVMLERAITPKDSEIAMGLRKSEAVIIDDESLIPNTAKEYVPASWAVRKADVKKLLKDGQQIPVRTSRCAITWR